jgi:hypothetical protein
VLGDFRLLFDVASPAEQNELLRLLIERVVCRGEGAETTIVFRADVNLRPSGSKLRPIQLPIRSAAPTKFSGRPKRFKLVLRLIPKVSHVVA